MYGMLLRNMVKSALELALAAVWWQRASTFVQFVIVVCFVYPFCMLLYFDTLLIFAVRFHN